MTFTFTNQLLGILVFNALILAFCASFWWQFRQARRRGMFSPLTEDLLRPPGYTLRERRGELADDLLFAYLGFILWTGFGFVAWFFLDSALRWMMIAVALSLMLHTIWKTRAQFSRLRAATLGGECEEYTGQELNYLMRKGAFVFHDIPYRYGNIDHVIVGMDRVLVVETKGVRKPRGGGGKSSRQAKVRFDGTSLIFPHVTTSQPIEQARCHAAFLEEVIRKKLGFTWPVTPVVALPGWFVSNECERRSDVLVINPKRSKALERWVGELRDREKRIRVLQHIESVARSITPRSKLTDPDAERSYDFWFNPRHRERRIGDE